MGRIIAVNMAHMRRSAAREKRDSVFEEIESTNKGTQLYYLTNCKNAALQKQDTVKMREMSKMLASSVICKFI